MLNAISATFCSQTAECHIYFQIKDIDSWMELHHILLSLETTEVDLQVVTEKM